MITLRNLDIKDAAGMLEWMLDETIMQYFRFDSKEMNLEKTETFIVESQQLFKEKTTLNYAIADEADEYMGTISLKHIDDVSKNAEYAICLRAKAQGKGYAMQATRLLLKIAFEELGLQRVYLNVLSHNEKAIHLYEKMGFTYEGEFRNHLMLHGQMNSLKWFAMLVEEYSAIIDGQGGKNYENYAESYGSRFSNVSIRI